MTQYTVKPYQNIPSSRCGRFDPADDCCICGRRLRSHDHTVNIAGGGSRWATEDDDPNHPGWMGAHYVGGDCHRRFSVKESQ